MRPPDGAKQHLFLKPGELFILEKPAVVSTVLGSCIAVTFYNRRLPLAAICHALLPRCQRHTYVNSINDILDRNCASCPDTFRYVDCSIAMMIESFSRRGISPMETQVQLFGGARMMTHQQRPGAADPVGHQNSSLALKILADHGLKLTRSDLGGTTGRKILFNTETGIVTLHKDGKITTEAIRAMEKYGL